MINKTIAYTASFILKEYDLCNSCLGRLFSKQLNLQSSKLLGKKLKHQLNHVTTKCYICKNLLDNLSPYLKLMLDRSEKYDFDSFIIGAIIKPSIIERDDFIRSKYKLKGIDSVKTEITKDLGKKFSKKTKKTINFLNPDLTFTINFKDESCKIQSKPIMLQGKYTKSRRGFPQKQKSCDNCSGTGCRVCNFHGISEYDSVEGKISEFFFDKFGGTTAKFTWVGGEDKSSLVKGSGRPFFVKIQNPLRRKISLPKVIKLNFLSIHNCKMISEFPKTPIKFNSLIEVKISPENEILPFNMDKLKEFHGPVVVYDKSGKRSEKTISNLKFKKTAKGRFTLTFNADGGLPIKRFVEGDEVSPSISQFLNNKCICTEFDFLDIFLK